HDRFRATHYSGLQEPPDNHANDQTQNVVPATPSENNGYDKVVDHYPQQRIQQPPEITQEAVAVLCPQTGGHQVKKEVPSDGHLLEIAFHSSCTTPLSRTP